MGDRGADVGGGTAEEIGEGVDGGRVPPQHGGDGRHLALVGVAGQEGAVPVGDQPPGGGQADAAGHLRAGRLAEGGTPGDLDVPAVAGAGQQHNRQ